MSVMGAVKPNVYFTEIKVVSKTLPFVMGYSRVNLIVPDTLKIIKSVSGMLFELLYALF